MINRKSKENYLKYCNITCIRMQDLNFILNNIIDIISLT